jgi:signal peptidase
VCSGLQASSLKKIFVFTLVVAICVFLNVFKFGGLMAYIIPSISWSSLTLITLYICGFEKIRLWFNKRLSVVAALTAIFQIFLLMDAGLVTGFGKSPFSFTPAGLTINLIFVLSTLLGIEVSRAYLAKNFGKKKPFLTLGLVTLLYTSITISMVGLLNILTLREPLAFVEFFGTTFLPTLAENLLASYLALLGGPIASLAYRCPLRAFQWFSPILPNLSWGFEALLGVMAPTIGFIYISQGTPLRLLRKIGIQTQIRRPRRFARSEKSSIRGWTIISVFCVLMVWTSTGLLGFYPTVILSGSMRPTIDVGDIAIAITADACQIQVGDIVQYWQEGEMTLHRVVEIAGEGDNKLFVTRGDANPIPNSALVFPAQIRGKLILIVPKLGWISIYIKKAIANIWSVLSTNTILTYTTASMIMFIASVYTVHTYKKRSYNYWRRKRGW